MTDQASFTYHSLKEVLRWGWIFDDKHPLVALNTPKSDFRIMVFFRDFYGPRPIARWQGTLGTLNTNWYDALIDSGAATSDFRLRKSVAGAATVLASEAVDLTASTAYPVSLQAVGSTLTAIRYKSDGSYTTLTATDTTFSSGYWGYVHRTESIAMVDLFMKTLPVATPAPEPIAFFEVPVVGSGSEEDPFRAFIPEEIVWEWSLNPMLKKKVDTFKSKGFSDEEIALLCPEVFSCRVNRLSLTHSSVIPTDSATGKPTEYTTVLMIYDQPDRQQHLKPLDKAVEALKASKGVRKISKEESQRRIKQLLS